MCDSDDDEFVSASEGEDEDLPLPKSIPVEKKKEEEEVVEEEKESIDTNSQSDGDHPTKEEENNKVDDEVEQRDPLPIEEEHEVEKLERDVIVDKTEEKVDADSIIPEISSLAISEETPCRKESSSSGEGKEKKEWEKVEELEEQSSVDEGKSGWDEWGDDTVDTPAKEEQKNKAKSAPKEVEEEESTDGWDDWGNDEVEEHASNPVEMKKEPVVPSSQPLDESRREEMLNKLGGTNKGTSGWGWGGMLTGIGETFSSAVESSLGLPSAHELAKKHADMEKIEGEKEKPMDAPKEQPPSSSSTQPSFGGFGMFSGLVHGGIDVLESIGKKTFETITVREEEKGRRRFIFEADRGENLSDVLKELREKNEAEAAVSASAGHSSSSSGARLPDMASSFERSDGMVHLEALEMVATNRPKQRQSVHRQLLALLENERVDVSDNDEEWASELREAVKQTGLPYSPDGIINVDHELDARLRAGDGLSSEELFKQGVDSLVQFTAASVHLVSKLASLLAVMGGCDFLPFVTLYRILSTRATHIANLYMLAISASDEGSAADELGTQVLVEASTATDFIRQAHALLIPIVETK